MSDHELSQPLHTLAVALAPIRGLPVTDAADLCVAAAHALTEQAGRIDDLEHEVRQARGIRPFAPTGADL